MSHEETLAYEALGPKGNGFRISSVEEIIADLAAGRMVVLVDEADRENEGDLVLAADFVTPEAINFMARFGRGLICLTLTEERCRALKLPLMVDANNSPHHTNFTVSIEAAEGVTTGISAADRARTVQAAVSRDARPEDIVQPGHIFPLRARAGGVLARAGHTEAGCDLARLAGCTPAAVICEILNEDGTMARLPDLAEFAQRHGIKVGTIVDLIHYRSLKESLVHPVAEREIETIHGPFRLVVYADEVSRASHLALVRGQVAGESAVPVRVHEPLSPIDLLDISDPGHSWNVNDALARIAEEDCGVVVLLNWPASGARFLDSLHNPLAPSGTAMSSAELRDYGLGAQILKDLGVRRMRLLGHPRKMPSMSGFDLEIVGYELPEEARGMSHRFFPWLEKKHKGRSSVGEADFFRLASPL